jgi:hypothetical protein
MPPAPKHPGARARRNQSSTASVLISDPEVEIPPLPTLSEGRRGLAPQRQGHVERSLVVSDGPGVRRFRHPRHVCAAALYDDFYKATSFSAGAKMAAEIRLSGQRFGTSPLDRRRLEWTIAQTEEAQDRGRRRRGQGEEPAKPPPLAANDPRAVLRAL